MAYGNNQDDSLIFNDKSLKNKLSNNNKYRYQYLSNKMNREILININLNYRDNLPKRNIKIAYYLLNINEPLYLIDVENIFRRPVIVDYCTRYIEDEIFYCCGKIRHLYQPQQDKFSCRFAQKGVIGSILLEEMMPRTKKGVIPDIIVNPHAFPSRMALNHLIEINIESEDLSSFEIKFFESNIPILEEMVNPITGKSIGNVLVGVCYYTVIENSRKNVLFKQPTEGKSHNGGLRIGEMKKDSLVVHSTNAIIQDLFKNNNTINIRNCKIYHSLNTLNT
ncbi:hypothetical protein U3516DRAFT_768601 [Neocallimastix sp. 'constans']